MMEPQVMSGMCAGVAKKIQHKKSKAFYVHCHAHRLNLVFIDVTKKKVMLAANFCFNGRTLCVHVFFCAPQ